MAQKTQAQITAEIGTLLADNTTGAITPVKLRTVVQDLNDSLLNTVSTQAINLVFASPASGGAALPTFRALVGADLPVPSLIALGGVKAIAAVAHQFLTSITTAGAPILGTASSADLTDVASIAFLASPVFTGNPTAPTAAAGDADTSIANTAFVASMVAPATGRNRVINGNFAINQRLYVSTTATASGTYMHDRWKSTTAATAYTFTQAKVDTTITIAAGTIAQVIEDVNVEGGVYTLSWSGTSTARVAINGGSTSGAFAASPITTASATAGQAITVEFATGTLGQIQLEPGSGATSFSRDGFSTSLIKCLRYYWKSFEYATAPVQNGGSFGVHYTGQIVAASANMAFPVVRFPVNMRGVPTITLYNPGAANAQARNFVTSTDFTVTTASFISSMGFVVTGTAPAATAVGQIVGFHCTAEAEL